MTKNDCDCLLRVANILFFLYIVYSDWNRLLIHLKTCFMKKITYHHHPVHLEKNATTVLLAIGFIGFVMVLSYFYWF